MSKTSTLFKYSALALVIGLSACDKSNPGNDDPLTCIAPQILNEAGDACIDDANALVVPAANQAVVYYKRQDGDYDGWGLHLWGDDMAEEGITWGTPLLPDGVHPLYGAYFLVDLTDENWTGFNFIVHNGDAKDIGGADLVYDRVEFGDDVFSFQGVAELFADPIEEIPVMLSGASAHFIDVLDADGASIMFPARVESNAFKLWHSPTASLVFDEETKTVSGGTAIDMALEPMSETQQDAMPHLKGLTGFWVDTTASEAKSLLKEQLWVVESNADGEAVQLTRVQTPNVLDALYATAAQDAQLGAYDNSGVTHFALWAPTAQSVSVQVFNAPTDLTPSETIALTEDTTTGIWGADASSDLTGKYYIYDISVFHHATDAIESYTVTDPYSLSLSTNSLFSQVVDLDDVSLQPAGGWTVNKAFTDVTNPEDISVYETHVRDITLWDGTGTEALNGKFKAFTESSRESMQHLQALRNAGMTAVQILPAFDIATIDEDESMRVDITDTMADYCAISTDAAAKAAELSLSCDATVIETALGTLDVTTGDAQDFYSHLRGVDSFNWGYDPFHYTVPEGSYATDPEGTTRIVEFREMVEALHDMDYMVVMDVVYNHTNASGLHEKSVLDKVVPGYYHRRDIASGAVTKDSCCDDTATEHDMMSKLMADSLVVWARDYQVDAFRFDLMGLQTKAAMENALAKVKAVNPDVYFYGEGWDYGAAGSNGRGENASQSNIAGTEIGTFTDRLRDGVRGGGPFDNMDGDEQSLRRNQGLSNSAVANELNLVTSVDPDAGTADDNAKTPDQELAENILKNADLVRLGLAGNLKTFGFKGYEGTSVTGATVLYGDSAAGYADDPQQIINYVSKHDNQTLWDIIAYKAADTVTSTERARMQALAVATSTFAQGVPFYHMGVDLLRSKSMERDSYDSGDWFNKVDFAANADSNWNVGLPREDKDGSNWDIIGTIIADTDSDPSTTDVQWMRDQFQEMLTIRADSPLFRLTTADEIKGRIAFHNTGADQTAGVIAMSIDDGVNAPSDLDANYDAIVVIFNYTNTSQDVVVDGAAGFTQHNAQTETTGVAFDAGTSTFTVPALTTAVFVADQGGAQGAGIPAGDVAPFASVLFRGEFTGWNNLSMFYTGEGIYKLSFKPTTDVTDGQFGFETDGAFNNHDQNVDFSSSEIAVGGTTGNATVSLVADTRYEMTFDANSNSFSIAIEAAPTFAAVGFKANFTSWSEVAMNYLGLNRYELYYAATADEPNGEFGIVTDGDWNAHDQGVDYSGSEIVIGGTSGNALISIVNGGEYYFYYDAANKQFEASEYVQPFDGNTIFVQGEVGAEDNTMTYEGFGVYTATISIDPANFGAWGNAGNFDFKIANAGFNNPNLGDSLDVTLPAGMTLANNGGNIGVAGIATATTLTFTFNAINLTVVVEEVL